MKERLDDQTIALRVAKEFQDGWYINLGLGIPTLCGNFIAEDKLVFFMAENGLLGYGRIQTWEEAQEAGWRFVDGGAQPVMPRTGMSVFDFAEAFDMIRGGHLDLTVLGALQVSETGDLANWSMGGMMGGIIGGAMDLAVGAKRVFAAMHHVEEKTNKPKILKQCAYPLTAKHCVDMIFTDLAVIEVTKQGLVLREIAPGWTEVEVQSLTEPRLTIADDLSEITL